VPAEPQGEGAKGPWPWLCFALLFAAVAGLVLRFELDPGSGPSPRLPWGNGKLDHRQIIEITMGLGAAGMVGLLVAAGLRGRGSGPGPRARRLARGGLLALTLLAGLHFLYARQGLYASQYAHRWDTFHYLLGTRYYAELDYDDLYECAIADLGSKTIPDDWAVRDLSTYKMSTAGELRALDRCRDHFSPERRERWRQDLSLFTVNRGAGILKGALEDRGYNGTPFHAAVSGALADRIPLTQATHQMAPLLDVGFICLMAAGATAAFGWELGLVFALFFFTNAADRFGIIGGSWFRYGWMASLVLGLGALRRGRHGLAGALITLSGLLNVFPILFAGGVLLRGAVEWLRTRRLPTRYRRFVLASLLTGLLGLGVGALPARGIDNYTGWRANMENHNVERFQGFGVGLKFPFAFRGGTTEATDKHSERQRRQWFHELRPAYLGLAALVLGLAGWVAARTRDDVEASVVLGFTLFFTLLGTVGYYFTVASVLVLGLHRRAREPGGLRLLALFFLSSLVAHAALHETLYYRFMYNTVLSTAWSLWLLAALGWLAWRLRRGEGEADPAPSGGDPASSARP
jgi:hypothetical protein